MTVPDAQPIGLARYLDDKQGAGKLESIAPGKTEARLILPATDTKRWSCRRKAAVLVAIRSGVITRGEACQRYLLSEEELDLWEAAFDRSGISGLRISSLRDDRLATQRQETAVLRQR